MDLFNKFNNKKRNEKNIIYEADEEGYKKIFGDNFVENNKNNINLIINGIKNNLIDGYKLKKGENKIKIIIKNKITNLEDMFRKCKSLKYRRIKIFRYKRCKKFCLYVLWMLIIIRFKRIRNMECIK